MLRALSEDIGEDAEDTARLRQMAAQAKQYLQSFRWCPTIIGEYFGDGVGGIAAVFQFEFATPIGGTDSKLWVVTGDIPSAYMVVEEGENPRDALVQYESLMHDWIKAVRSGGRLDEVYPVNAAATRANADDLESRLAFIREEIIERAP